jgi:hypothetical protein
MNESSGTMAAVDWKWGGPYMFQLPRMNKSSGTRLAPAMASWRFVVSTSPDERISRNIDLIVLMNLYAN